MIAKNVGDKYCQNASGIWEYEGDIALESGLCCAWSGKTCLTRGDAVTTYSRSNIVKIVREHGSCCLPCLSERFLCDEPGFFSRTRPRLRSSVPCAEQSRFPTAPEFSPRLCQKRVALCNRPNTPTVMECAES